MRLFSVREVGVRSTKGGVSHASCFLVGGSEYDSKSVQGASNCMVVDVVEHPTVSGECSQLLETGLFGSTLKAIITGGGRSRGVRSILMCKFHDFSSFKSGYSPYKEVVGYHPPRPMSYTTALTLFSINKLSRYLFSSSNAGSCLLLSMLLPTINSFKSSNWLESINLKVRNYVIVNPVMNANDNYYVLTMVSPCVVNYCMTSIDNTNPVCFTNEPSLWAWSAFSKSFLMFNVIPNVNVVNPVFVASDDEFRSYTYGEVAPWVASSASLAGEYDLKREYLEFYNMILEAGPLITAGAIMDATPKVIQLKYALARFVAMGYSTMPSLIYRELSPELSWLTSPDVFNYFILRAKRLVLPKLILFLAPSIIPDTGQLVISRVPPLNVELMQVKATSKLLVYYSMVLFHGYSAAMFVRNMPKFEDLMNRAIDVAVTQIGTAALSMLRAAVSGGFYTPLIRSTGAKIVKIYEVFKQLEFVPGLPRKHAVLKIGFRAFSLSEFLNACTKYAMTLFRAFAAASLSGIMFGVFARRYAKHIGVPLFKAGAEIYSAVLDFCKSMHKDEGLLSKIIRRQADAARDLVDDKRLGGLVSDFIKFNVFSSVSLGDAFTINVWKASGPVDPTPVGMFNMATGILNNAISMMLGANLALLDAINIVLGANPFLNRLVVRWFSLLGKWLVSPTGDISLFSKVLNVLMPKDVSEFLNKIRVANEFYHDYLKIFFPIFAIVSQIAPILPKIAYYVAKEWHGFAEAWRVRRAAGPIKGLKLSSQIIINYASYGFMARKLLYGTVLKVPSRVREKIYDKELERYLNRYPTYPTCCLLPPDYLDDDSKWAWYRKYIS